MTEASKGRRHAAEGKGEEPTPVGDSVDVGQPQTAETDPRHPDTTADQGSQPPALDPGEEAVLSGEQQEIPATDPKVYGFRPIEVTETDETGPGSIPPTEVPAVSQGETFADRAKSAAGRGESKAVQPDRAENK